MPSLARTGLVTLAFPEAGDLDLRLFQAKLGGVGGPLQSKHVIGIGVIHALLRRLPQGRMRSGGFAIELLPDSLKFGQPVTHHRDYKCSI